MSRLAVICYPDKAALSKTAQAVVAGGMAKGAFVDVYDAVAADGAPLGLEVLESYDAAAFGFAAQGTEGEREAFLQTYVKGLAYLCGKKVGVFGDIGGEQGFSESLVQIGKYAGCYMMGSYAREAEMTDELYAACGTLGESLVLASEPRPDLAGTVPIIFSTITGNGYKLAAAVADVVPDHVGPYNIRYINDEVIEKFNTFILSYWCNHGTADDDTIALIHRMHGKKLIVIGTLGVARDTKHPADVCAHVESLASEHNTLLGHYLCRGSIDLKRTVARTRIPEGQKGHLSMERFERQKQSLGHPNAEELAEAREAVKEFLKKA